MRIKTIHPYRIKQVNNFKKARHFSSFLNFKAEKTCLPKILSLQKNLMNSKIQIIKLIVSCILNNF